ncbi:MAG: ABC transporter permease [Lachnospiraceae bacterium]|nr:ABC transporter permease [Lachnospiraceae bacterium]
MVKLGNSLKKLYIGLIVFFLYAPILVLVVLSFNKSKFRNQWGGFTLDWYRSLFSNDEVMSALGTTLLIALCAALIASIIGTAAAFAINKMKKIPKALTLGITNIPMLNADIVTAISLMLLFTALGFTFGFFSVLLAHITFSIPYVVLSVMPKLSQMSRANYEAALDLGATPFQAFRKVVFPEILPGVLSGFMLAFTMSLDDFIITWFTTSPDIHTLSTVIYSMQRRGISPEIYALSTLMFVVIVVLLILCGRTQNKNQKKARS